MPITVMQILPALEGGGVERGTLEVANELVRKGHRSIVLSAGGRLVEALRQSGSEHVDLPLGKKSLLLLRYIPLLRKIFSGVDIIDVHSRFPAWLAWLAWRGMDEQTRPGFITTVHGANSVNRYSRIMTSGERIIVVSGYIRNYIIENYPGIKPDHIFTIPRGIDPDVYYPGFTPTQQWRQDWHQQYPRLQGRYLLTLPGRITRRKGHEDFLGILSGLKDKIPGIHGLVVGTHHPRKLSYFQSLQKMAEAMGIKDKVTFTGHRNDLREIMSISDIVLSLSGKPEAFGRTALESLCLGTPVIAYDHGGASEILQALFIDGLVEPENINAVIDKVMAIQRNKPGISQRNPFLLQDMLDQTIRCYEDLAGTG